MHSKKNNVRSLVIALAAAVLLAGLILLAFVLQRGTESGTGITLPAETAQAVSQESGAVDENLFLQVTRENVQNVIATMHRESVYHQTLQLTVSWEETESVRTAEVWVSGDLVRVDTTSGDTVKSCLSDGNSVYIWYQDDPEAVAEIRLDETVSKDDLMGIPTYEEILNADPASIRTASYETEKNNRNCIVAEVEQDGCTVRYWVDTATGVLCRAESIQDGNQTYQMEQASMESLLASDEALSAVFTLPDGSCPY